MDTEGLSVICAGIGTIEVDDEGNVIGYIKGQYCLGTNLSHFQFSFFFFLFYPSEFDLMKNSDSSLLMFITDYQIT